MKTLLYVFIIAVTAASCNQAPVNSENPPVAQLTDTLLTGNRFLNISHYEGVLPCADCPGIRTRLALIADNMTYQRLDTYMEARDGKDYSYVSTGKYQTERGYGNNSSAVLYILDHNKPGEQAFLQVNDSTIEMLDHDRKQIKSQLNYQLILVSH